MLKQRTQIQLNVIKTGVQQKALLKDTEMKILLFSQPECFRGKKSKEILFDKNFNDSCISIEKHLNLNVKDMSGFDYYNALDYLKRNSDG